MVVYGHTPVPEPEWLNRTICIDTGCVFGGRLTALRYPERELVSVAGRRDLLRAVAAVSAGGDAGAGADRAAGGRRRARHGGRQRQAHHRDAPRRQRHHPRGERRGGAGGHEPLRRQSYVAHLSAADDVAVRDQRARPACSNIPSEAFAYFRGQGVPRGGVRGEAHGLARRGGRVPRRGRRAPPVRRRGRRRRHLLHAHRPPVLRRRDARDRRHSRACELRSTAADLWRQLDTDWACLDCELMPWSAKAQELLRTQYAAVGSAGTAALADVAAALEAAAARAGEPGAGAAALLARTRQRADDVRRFVDSLSPLLLGGRVARRSEAGAVPPARERRPRPRRQGPRLAHAHRRRAVRRRRRCCSRRRRFAPSTWPTPPARRTPSPGGSDLTGRGGEGMVVKPHDFVARGPRGLVQPAVKCRGPEYLRIIYGPEYLAPENLDRLRARGLSAQAKPRAARVRPRHRGARTLRPRRAAAPGSRVRLRRAGAGERARRPAAVARRERLSRGGPLSLTLFPARRGEGTGRESGSSSLSHLRERAGERASRLRQRPRGATAASVAPRRARVGVGLPGDGHEAPVVVAAAQGQLEHALHARAARLAGRLDRVERALPRVAGADDERPDAAGRVRSTDRLSSAPGVRSRGHAPTRRRPRRGPAAPAISRSARPRGSCRGGGSPS